MYKTRTRLHTSFTGRRKRGVGAQVVTHSRHERLVQIQCTSAATPEACIVQSVGHTVCCNTRVENIRTDSVQVRVFGELLVGQQLDIGGAVQKGTMARSVKRDAKAASCLRP